MKRFIKCLIKKFSNLNKKGKLACLLAIVVATMLVVSAYTLTDTTPATEFDYNQLENKAKALEGHAEKILEEDSTIVVNGREVVVEFENDECSVHATYDKENGFKLLSTSKYDKMERTAFKQLGVAVFAEIAVTAYVSAIIYGILYVIEGCIKKIITAIKN